MRIDVMDELLKALRSYEQADEEGIMCVVSRQAVEEAANEIERLTKKLERAKSVNNAAWNEGRRQGMLAAGAVL